MGNVSTNVSRIQQDFATEITQQSIESCSTSATQNVSGNISIIDGAKSSGDIIGINVESVSTDATCVLTSSIDAAITNILDSVTRQTNAASNDWFGGFSFSANTNVYNLRQSAINNINQINQSLCSSNVTSSTTNNFSYIRNVNGGRVIGLNIEGATASASCSITNVTKALSFNRAASEATQDNKNTGMFVAIVTAIIAVVGIVIVGVIILFSIGAIGYVGYSVASGGKTPGIDPIKSQLTSTLESLDALDLPPDILQSLFESDPTASSTTSVIPNATASSTNSSTNLGEVARGLIGSLGSQDLAAGINNVISGL